MKNPLKNLTRHTYGVRGSMFAAVAFLATLAAGCGDSTNGSPTPDPVDTDTTAPSVSSTVPRQSATGVALGGHLAITFSEEMDPASITAATITLKQGTVAIIGAVAYTGVTAVFTSATALAPSTSYSASVTVDAKDLAGNALAAAYDWDFSTGTAVDATAPSVSATVPLTNATGVAIGGNLAATFSEAMNPLSITTSSFTLKRGATAVAGAVAYAGVTATFKPTAALLGSTVYTATITTGAEDLAGNPLAANYEWLFTSGTTPDITAPTVDSTFPVQSATGVALGGNIAAVFSEAMNPLTITSATIALKQGPDSIPGVVAYAGVTATFNPTAALVGSTIYTATVTAGVKDLAGNVLAQDYVWSFTTGDAPDTSAPSVSSAVPLNGAIGVAIRDDISATFSEAMDPLTVTTSTFTLKQELTSVEGVVVYAGLTATFDPTIALAVGTLYTATIKTGAEDLAGNPMANAFVWTFTTGASTPLGPDPVELGRAGGFAILAMSGIDSVPTSAVTGNIGVSPIDSTAITGFSLTADASNQYSTSIQVTGQVQAADYAVPTPRNLTTAVENMLTAYTDAAGRSLPDHTELGAGEIGGMTLAPGLYKWGTDVTITTDVILNGSPNDVWIFQIAQGITQASATRVHLSGGALPKNVFWQTFGQVVIGTTAHFEGIVLCQTAIILATGASVNGRLLAQTAVTLDANAVTQPAP